MRGRPVVADVDGIVEPQLRVEHAGRGDELHAERRERAPVPDRDDRVDERNFGAVTKRLALRPGQLRHHEGHHHVVARHDDAAGLHRLRRSGARVGDLDLRCRCVVAAMRDPTTVLPSRMRTAFAARSSVV